VLCIRHYLRRNTPREIAPPVIVVGRMNEIVYDCCRERSCLSCFYAQYTPGSRVLRYVNAGHGAPVLIRRNPEEVLLLDGGGPVFGLQESPVYMERVVRLRIGDRLVAFTHGVVEALADRNPRSAESLLISLVRRNRRLKAIDLANQIIRECEHLRSETRLDQSVFVASLEDLIPSSYGTAAMHAQLGLVGV
jgi:sigma-B regulation protein RsbU (phosphoserine phosphatase)